MNLFANMSSLSCLTVSRDELKIGFEWLDNYTIEHPIPKNIEEHIKLIDRPSCIITKDPKYHRYYICYDGNLYVLNVDINIFIKNFNENILKYLESYRTFVELINYVEDNNYDRTFMIERLPNYYSDGTLKKPLLISDCYKRYVIEKFPYAEPMIDNINKCIPYIKKMLYEYIYIYDGIKVETQFNKVCYRGVKTKCNFDPSKYSYGALMECYSKSVTQVMYYAHKMMVSLDYINDPSYIHISPSKSMGRCIYIDSLISKMMEIIYKLGIALYHGDVHIRVPVEVWKMFPEVTSNKANFSTCRVFDDRFKHNKITGDMVNCMVLINSYAITPYFYDLMDLELNEEEKINLISQKKYQLLCHYNCVEMLCVMSRSITQCLYVTGKYGRAIDS